MGQIAGRTPAPAPSPAIALLLARQPWDGRTGLHLALLYARCTTPRFRTCETGIAAAWQPLYGARNYQIPLQGFCRGHQHLPSASEADSVPQGICPQPEGALEAELGVDPGGLAPASGSVAHSTDFRKRSSHRTDGLPSLLGSDGPVGAHSSSKQVQLALPHFEEGRALQGQRSRYVGPSPCLPKLGLPQFQRLCTHAVSELHRGAGWPPSSHGGLSP